MKPYFSGINGLRAISICLVIFSHLSLQYHVFAFPWITKWGFPLVAIITDGNLGVNVFFVISGFLITALLLQEEHATHHISLKNFYIRRVLRIFPAYYFLLFIYFLLQCMGYIYINEKSWLTSLTYTKYFYMPDWYTGHAWSLSIEEHFYLFWPLIFVSGKKIRRVVAVLVIIAVLIIKIIIQYHPMSWITDVSIFTKADAIAIGCLTAIYQDKLLSFLGKRWHLFFLLSVDFLLLWIVVFSVFTHTRLGIWLNTIYSILGVGNGIVANILIAIIMLYSIFGPKTAWHKLLDFKAVNYIGVLSYSIYLWQQFFINNTRLWFNQFPLNLLCVLFAALFSYYVIERPFLKLKSRFH